MLVISTIFVIKYSLSILHTSKGEHMFAIILARYPENVNRYMWYMPLPYLGRLRLL